MRHRWRVRSLAREEGLDAETAALVLMEAGVEGVSGPDDYVGRDTTKAARESLRAYLRSLQGPPQTAPRAAATSPLVKWPRLSPEQITYLTVTDVAGIHVALATEFAQTEDAIEPPGIKSRELLESAVARPQVASAKYPNVVSAGGALVHALISNHPFHNGNKRTALISLAVYLQRNRYYCDFDDDAVYKFIVAISDHSIAPHEGRRPDADQETLAAYRWIQKHAKRQGELHRRIKWAELERIFVHFGCRLATRPGNRMLIERDGVKYVAGYRSKGTEVDEREIRKIRVSLDLDESAGYDDFVFYGRGVPFRRVEEAIEKYQGVLHRLALLDPT